MSVGGKKQGIISEDLQAKARPLLDLVDQLRKDGVQTKLTIPQIAVMGDQSSGKSSVLESISGIQFPRGAGLVTRCATQITMSQGREWSAELRAEGEVRKLGAGEQATLTKHIEELTVKLCGGAGGFSEKLIEVKLEAPDAPDLTIIGKLLQCYTVLDIVYECVWGCLCICTYMHVTTMLHICRPARDSAHAYRWPGQGGDGTGQRAAGPLLEAGSYHHHGRHSMQRGHCHGRYH